MQHKMTKILLMSILTLTMILPFNVSAKNINIESDLSLEKYVNILAKTNNYTCSGENDESILGDVNNEEDVAWLIQKLLNYIKILGPSLAIVLSSLDYVKAIISSDENEMKKSNSKFAKRMLAAVLLFFIPTLTSLLLGLFGLTSDCGIS